LGHIEKHCWKKDPKTSVVVMNYLEVMVDDEKTIRNQLDRIYGIQDLFSHTRVPRHKALMDAIVGGHEEVDEGDLA
jgi:adenylyl- and sulfurtransferase ThiI